jgi:hypothetical protein
LRTCFSLARLGNGDVTITVTTIGGATTLCTNQGGNTAPGQNKTPVKPNASWLPELELDYESDRCSVRYATVTVVQGGQVALQQTFKL